MSEYIVDVGNADELHFAAFQKRAEFCFGYPVREEIVRCRDCKYCIANVCMSPDGDGDYLRFEVLPDGFCKWGERRGEVE